MRRPSLNNWLFIIALLVITVPLGPAALKLFVTKDVPFIRPEAGAKWIKLTIPFNLGS